LLKNFGEMPNQQTGGCGAAGALNGPLELPLPLRSQNMDTEQLVEVFSTTHEAEAEVVRVQLEAEGIDCQISGANQGSFSGVLDVKIFVKAADEELARSVINDR
jgi:hypothetical protein